MAAQSVKKLSEEELQLYREHFQMFDLNGDGTISSKELRKASRRLGYRLTDQQIEVTAHCNYGPFQQRNISEFVPVVTS